jgi:hypothetical protein
LRRLQAVDRKTFKARHRDIFKAWIRNLIPGADPGQAVLGQPKGGSWSTTVTRIAMNFFHRAHPWLSRTHWLALGISRARRRLRSDGIDLMHTVIALAYCDHFLVRDGFVRTCAEQATKALRPMAWHVFTMTRPLLFLI